MSVTIYDDLEACAKAALAADFDPVPWDEAPRWRQFTSIAVAKAALETGNPDFVRSAWTLEMTKLGWRWEQTFDEARKTHPGIVFGELTSPGTRHWMGVIKAVREVGKARGMRMLGV